MRRSPSPTRSSRPSALAVDGVIFHSDHGAQYGAKAFADACHRAGIRRSMGAVGTSTDNAVAESFFASLQREILPSRRGWPTQRAARLARLPPARLLQPAAQALHDRLPRANRLRTETNYSGHRCLTTGVHDQGGSPVSGEGGTEISLCPSRARLARYSSSSSVAASQDGRAVPAAVVIRSTSHPMSRTAATRRRRTCLLSSGGKSIRIW